MESSSLAAPGALRDALDAWAEDEARRTIDVPGAPWTPQQEAANYGQTVVEPGEDADASSLALTREVISTWQRYRLAATRVCDALQVATVALTKRLEEASRASAWSLAGMKRLQALAARREAHVERMGRVLRCTSGQVGVPVFRCGSCGEEQEGVPMGCNARICPRCAPKLRAANQAKIIDLLAAVDVVRQRRGSFPARWRFITLTVRSQRAFLPMRRFVARAWGKLIRRKFWLRSVGACIAFFETTHTAAGWHVHVHALVDGYVHRPLLVDAWHKVTAGEGEEQGVHVSLPKGDRRSIAFELAKYAAKDLGGAATEDEREWGVAGTPERLAEFYLGTLRWRTLRTYGDAFAAISVLEEHDVTGAMACDCCGGGVTFDRTRWVSASQLVERRRGSRRSPRDRPP